MPTIEPDKGFHIVPTNGDQVCVNVGTIIQCYPLRAFLKGKPSGNTEEIVQYQLDVTTGPDELAVTGQHVKGDGFGNTDGNVKSVSLVIDQSSVICRHIDLHRQGVGRKSDSFNAVK